MKTRILILFLPILLFLNSCEKEETDLPANFKVIKAGNEWVPTISSVVYSVHEKKFMIHAQKGTKSFAEILYIGFEINDLSNPFHGKIYSSLYDLTGGDILSNSFTLTPDLENTIHITSLDTIGKEITGTFNLKLVGDAHYQQPDTILLTEGFFSLPYQEAYYYSK